VDYGVVRNEQGALLLESGNSPVMIRGMDALIQTVLIELCSKPLPSQGGSGFASGLFEEPLGSTDVERILAARLRNARQNILAYQRDASLSSDEQLADLRLLAVRDGSSREADISITSVSGLEVVRTLG
jgi:hypothetical protein